MSIQRWRGLVAKATPAFLLAWLLLAAGSVPPLVMAAPACTITWDGGGGTDSWHLATNWDTNVVPGAGDHVCIPAAESVTFSTGTSSVLSIQVAGSLTITGGTLNLTSATEESAVEGTMAQSAGTIGGAATMAVSGTFTWNQGLQEGSGETRIDMGGSLVIDAGYTPDPTARLGGSRVLRNDGGAIEHIGELVIADTATVRNDVGTYEGGATSSPGPSLISCDATACADTLVFNAATLESDGFFMVGARMANAGTVQATFADGFLTLIDTTFVAGSHVGAGAGTVFFENVSIDGATTIDTGGTADVNPGGAIDGAGTLSIDGTLIFDSGTQRGTGETRIEAGGTLVIGEELLDSGGGPITVAQPVLEGSRVVRNDGGLIEHTGTMLVGGTATVRNDAGTYEGKTSPFELSLITCDAAGCADTVLFNAAGAIVESTGQYFVNVGLENSGTVRATGAVLDDFLTIEADTGTMSTFKTGSNVGAGDGTVFLGNLVSVDGATTIDAGATVEVTVNSTIEGAGLLTVKGVLRVTSGVTQQGSGETRVVAGGKLEIHPDPDPQAARLTGSRVLRNAGGTIEQIGDLEVGGTATIHNDSGTYDGHAQTTGLSIIYCDPAGCPAPAFINAAVATLQSSGTFFVNVGLENSGTVRATAVDGFLTLETQDTQSTFVDGSHVGAGDGTVYIGGTVQVGDVTIDAGGTADANPLLVIEGSGTLSVAGTFILDMGIMRGSGETEILAGGLLVVDREVLDLGLPLQLADAPILEGSRILRNSGGTIEQRSNFVVGGTATIQNDSGTFQADPSNGSSLSLLCATGGCADPALVNAGMVESVAPGTFTVNAGFNNPGTVHVNSGTMELKGSFAQFSAATKTLVGGTYLLQGVFKFVGADIEANAATILLDGLASAIVAGDGANGLAHLASNSASGELAIDNDRDLTTPGPFANAGDVNIGQNSAFTSTGSYTQTAGTTRLDAALSVLTATGAIVDIQGGTLAGTGTAGPSVVNAGTVEPGSSPGILHVAGTYTQGPSGILRVELGGTTVGTGYDRLDVSGGCSLNGTLSVATVGGFSPGAGDEFRFLSCAARTGTFSTVDGTTLTVTYDTTGASLGSQPSISVADVTVTEGNTGTTPAAFVVSLSSASSATVTVHYATADVSAAAPGDYASANDSLVFSPGQTTKTVDVSVVGDTLDEADETFRFELSSATNATISDGLAIGTIVDDDDVADRIVFSSSRTGLGDIYVMNADGTGLVRLTTSIAPDLEPVWSPDRTRIAFTSARSGSGDIYVMNADGSGQTRLTTNSSIDGSPAWSPDGTKIAFASGRTGNGDIYVMNANGSGQTRLTTSSSLDGFPDWSPDGTKIAFGSGRTGNGDIYVMNANGSGQTQLTTSSGFDGFPDWSPDGTKIAFASSRTGNGDIYVMNANGSGQTRLTTSSGVDGEPAWFRTGAMLAFSSLRDGNPEIYAMNANGSGQTRLTRHASIDLTPDP